MSLVRTKRLHDIDLRVRKDTEIAFLLDTVVRGVQYHAGDVVTGSLRKDARKLEYLFLRKRIGLWRLRELPDTVGEADGMVQDGESDEVVDTPADGEDSAGEDEAIGDDGDSEDPVRPQPYKHGPGWWKIEGVDESFRSADEAQAAWDLNHALGG